LTSVEETIAATHEKEEMSRSKKQRSARHGYKTGRREDSVVLGILHLSDNIVSLAEEGKPLIQHFLVLVVEVVPFRSAFFRLEG
jgi:hypothetical protein